MSLQILNPKWAAPGHGGLEKFKLPIFVCILGLPLVMAALPFINPHGGYTLAGAFCAMPLRPFWYRLFLSWVPRYFIGATILVLTVVIRMRVKKYQEELGLLEPATLANHPEVLEDGVIEEEDESEGPDSRNAGSTSELVKPEEDNRSDKRRTIIDNIPLPPMPDSHQPFDSEYLKKFKRQSYRKQRQLPAVDVDAAMRNGSFVAGSVAPSSAIFSPPAFREHLNTTDTSANRHTTTAEILMRRKSIALLETPRSTSVSDMPPMPLRRSSVVELTPRSNSVAVLPTLNPGGADRYMSTGGHSRRSSIWDEIDASLERKVTNRLSVFSAQITIPDDNAPPMPDMPPKTPTRAPSRSNSITGMPQRSGSTIGMPQRSGSVTGFPQRSNSFSATAAAKRKSRIVSVAQRTMSIISFRGLGEEEPMDSASAILRRRHRYIQRQLRYLMIYPIVYFLIWLFPFILHCLQFSDRFAADPPFPIIVLYIISTTIFGAANSLVFCLREKPWTMIPDSDGTILGSFRLASFGWVDGGLREVASPEIKGAEVTVVTDGRYNEKF